ncbi:TPA: stress responsive protein [Candidatus Delongbacteria bacterium]|nr:stress responsive protein [Candidatus Delongbacteria bacterium]
MVKHIVMWKMKKDKGSAQSAMNALEIKKKLERLTSTIIEIKDLEVGMNFSNADRAFDVVLYTEFNTKRDFEHYLSHPEHIKVKAFIDSVIEERAIVDFEDDIRK